MSYSRQLRRRRYQFLNGLNDPILTLGEQQYGLLDLLILIGLILGLWLAVRNLTMLLKSRILKLIGVDRGLQEAITILTQYILTFLGVVVILQFLGVDISALLILGGALGSGLVLVCRILSTTLSAASLFCSIAPLKWATLSTLET